MTKSLETENSNPGKKPTKSIWQTYIKLTYTAV